MLIIDEIRGCNYYLGVIVVGAGCALGVSG